MYGTRLLDCTREFHAASAVRSSGEAKASALALDVTTGISPFFSSAFWIFGLSASLWSRRRRGVRECVGIDQPSPGPPVTTGGAQNPALLPSDCWTEAVYQLPSIKNPALPASNMFSASTSDSPS